MRIREVAGLACGAAWVAAPAAAADGETALAALRAGRQALTVEATAVDGRPLQLTLDRFHVISPRTQVVVVGTEGRAVERPADLDAVKLYRGVVAGEPGSRVFVAVHGDAVSGHVEGSGGRYDLRPPAPGSDGSLVLAPAALAGGPPPGIAWCGVDGAGGVAAVAGGGDILPGRRVIELAVETDYELFELFGDADEAMAYVVTLFGAVSDIFDRDVQAVVELTFVRIWETPDDMFNEPDPLGPFRNWWNKNEQDVPRDVAQFLSGRRDLPYGGVAYLSSLCGSTGYSVGYALGFFDNPQTPHVNNYDIAVTAHELGHNCGTLHTHDYGIDSCNDLNGVPQRGTIMSYCSQTVSGGNAITDLRFHTTPQDAMRQHIDSRDCLDDDCNGNGLADLTDIGLGISADANGNGVPDECEDCNGNGTLDDQDIASGTSSDANNNGLPDECEPDCNGNGTPDAIDIGFGDSDDLHGNGIPDECEPDCDGDGTSDYSQIQADLGLDVDRDTVLDACQDCDGDGVSDLAALEGSRHCWVAGVGDGRLRQFHPLTGVLTAVSPPASAPAEGQDVIVGPAGDVLASSRLDHRVARFDREGAFLGDLVASGAGGLSEPAGLALSPAGDLLVASRGTDSVLAYDAVTGAAQGAFVAPGAGGLAAPYGLTFGPDGDLYVTSADGRVIRFDGASGAPAGDFVASADNGGLTTPRGVLFKPDGNLLVASFDTNSVLEFDGASGAFLGKFNRGGTEDALTLDGPWALRLGPDGHVHVSRHLVQAGGHDDDGPPHLHINSTRIYIFDVENGNFLRSYVTGNDTGLDLPTGFAFLPDAGTDCNGNFRPDACDILSGSSLDANGDGVPDECQGGCPADLNGDGAVDVLDLVQLVLAWGACPPGPCPADLNDDGAVDVLDLVELILAWGGCG